MTNDPIIKIEQLEKSFGDLHVLKGIDLEVNRGEVVCIIGASGSGKSTLLRCINLLERPTEGSVVIDGTAMETLNAAQLRERRRDITMIFQQFNLLMQRNCLKNICFPLELEGMKKEDAKKRALELLEIVGLPDKAKAYPAQLSGGQQQRLCIARALLKKPAILVLDDSTSAVDTKTDALIRKAFREEIPDTTKIIIAQRISSVQDADAILVLDDGRISGYGTHEQLLASNEIYHDIYISQTKGDNGHDEA